MCVCVYMCMCIEYHVKNMWILYSWFFMWKMCRIFAWQSLTFVNVLFVAGLFTKRQVSSWQLFLAGNELESLLFILRNHNWFCAFKFDLDDRLFEFFVGWHCKKFEKCHLGAKTYQLSSWFLFSLLIFFPWSI